jgi:hypothetical protein
VGKVDFSAMARSAGFPNVYQFEDTEGLTRGMGPIMQQEGPTFVNLICAPNRQVSTYPLIHTREIVDDFAKAVQALPTA